MDRSPASRTTRNRKRAAVAAGAIPALVLAGSVFYWATEGWDPLDAFYFSVVTLTTVGFGDLVPTHPLSKAFTVAYALCGVATLGMFLRWFVRRAIEPATRPFIGAQLVANDRLLARRLDLPTERGVVALSVYPRSRAWTAGLQPDDIVLAVDGREVASPDDVTDAITAAMVGPPPRLTVVRAHGLTELRLDPVDW